MCGIGCLDLAKQPKAFKRLTIFVVNFKLKCQAGCLDVKHHAWISQHIGLRFDDAPETRLILGSVVVLRLIALDPNNNDTVSECAEICLFLASLVYLFSFNSPAMGPKTKMPLPFESQSKQSMKMVYPEPCKEVRRRPQLIMVGVYLAPSSTRGTFRRRNLAQWILEPRHSVPYAMGP